MDPPGFRESLELSGWGIAAWLAAERVRYATRSVFVDQPAEQVAAADAIEIDPSPTGCSRVGGSVPSGGRWSSARCGRCWL